MPVSVPPSIPPVVQPTSASRVSNWGRWGPDDELGTLNLIDEAARLRGMAAVEQGNAFALGLPLSAAEGIQMGFVPGRVNPTRTMICVNEPLSADPEWIASSEDSVSLSLQCSTHWDGLAHVSYGAGPGGGRLYNGFPASSVTGEGAGKLGIHLVRTLVSHGVLLDLPRAKGTRAAGAGLPRHAGGSRRGRAFGGITVESGDVVLVRTGQAAHLALPGRPGIGGAEPRRDLVAYTWPTPGLTVATAEWFHRHDVAAVATDTMVLEVYPCEDPDLYLPVHLLHLVEMGMTQGQNWFLDELADACAEDGRYGFLLDATPLPFTNALGSPVNPVAIR